MFHCPDCGYPNDTSDHRCERCGIRFAGQTTGAVAAALVIAPPKEARPAGPPPPWRGELSERVARFRERRGLQPVLPLEFPDPEAKVIPFPQPERPAAPGSPTRPAFPPQHAKGRRAGDPAFGRGGVEAPARSSARRGSATSRRPPEAAQPALDFSPLPPAASATEETTLDFPVAPLLPRILAGGTDAVLVVIGYGLLFTAYHLMGGDLPWHRWTLLATLAALVVLPLFYLFLFLLFTAGTPGMRWIGLRLVDFRGRPASRSRRLGRVLASVASGGSFLLGFLWAAVDEEHLTWHDRMSETCLTLVPWDRHSCLSKRR